MTEDLTYLFDRFSYLSFTDEACENHRIIYVHVTFHKYGIIFFHARNDDCLW